MVAVDICNLALGYLGDVATVASIDPPDGSAQADHCARFYPMALALMLDAHDWNFATKRSALAVLTTPYADWWQFAYAVPGDAARILTIIPSDLYGTTPSPLTFVTPYPSAPIWAYFDRVFPFELEGGRWRDFRLEVDAQGRSVLLSNIPDAIARYTSTEVSTAVFPALFTDALAWKLASMLAGPLLKGDAGAAESKRCLQASEAMAARAMAKDANQQRSASRPEPAWMRNR